MTFPLRLDHPTKLSATVPSMFKNNVEIMCPSKLSKSLSNPKKVQGPTIKTFDQIRRLPMTSNDAPQISARIRPLLTQLPWDAPHRSTHQTFIPLSPILLWLSQRSVMVWLMLKASAKTWKTGKAERQANDSWQNSIKQEPKI